MKKHFCQQAGAMPPPFDGIGSRGRYRLAAKLHSQSLQGGWCPGTAEEGKQLSFSSWGIHKLLWCFFSNPCFCSVKVPSKVFFSFTPLPQTQCSDLPYFVQNPGPSTSRYQGQGLLQFPRPASKGSGYF